MTGHVFISYSHHDAGDYVHRLAAHLTAAGIPVWFDQEIITGTRWATVIRDRIDTSAAVIVVMTPHGERSEWVGREIDQAQLRQRPVLPLLLDGERYFALATEQYEKVAGGIMPSPAFVARLRTLVFGGPVSGGPVSGGPGPGLDPRRVAEFVGQRDQAWRTGEAGDRASAIRSLTSLLDGTTLGPDHLEVLIARRYLAINTSGAGRTAEAIEQLAVLITDATRALGPDHTEVLLARRYLAGYTGVVGLHRQAAEQLTTLIADLIRVLGPDHREVAVARGFLDFYAKQ